MKKGITLNPKNISSVLNQFNKKLIKFIKYHQDNSPLMVVFENKKQEKVFIDFMKKLKNKP